MRFPFLAPFLTAFLLASCAIGPKYSLRELETIYGNPFSNASLIEAAAAKGNVEHIKSLLHYNPTEKEIVAAFFTAIKSGHLETVKFIRKRKPEVMNWTKDEKDPIVYSVFTNNDEIFSYFLDKDDIDQESVDNLYAIIFFM